MKKTTKIGIGLLPSITDNIQTEAPHSPEMDEEHAKLRRKYDKARAAMSQRRGKPGKGLREEEEVARANLRAFERKNGYTTP